jgi:hypothetical protein
MTIITHEEADRLIEVCLHDVEYGYDLDQIPEAIRERERERIDKHCAEEADRCAKESIVNGWHEGDLCMIYLDEFGNDYELFGYWSIAD